MRLRSSRVMLELAPLPRTVSILANPFKLVKRLDTLLAVVRREVDTVGLGNVEYVGPVPADPMQVLEFFERCTVVGVAARDPAAKAIASPAFDTRDVHRTLATIRRHLNCAIVRVGFLTGWIAVPRLITCGTDSEVIARLTDRIGVVDREVRRVCVRRPANRTAKVGRLGVVHLGSNEDIFDWHSGRDEMLRVKRLPIEHTLTLSFPTSSPWWGKPATCSAPSVIEPSSACTDRRCSQSLSVSCSSPAKHYSVNRIDSMHEDPRYLRAGLVGLHVEDRRRHERRIQHFSPRAARGERTATVTLYDFSDTVELVYEAIPIGEAPTLNNENYRPGGKTALHDALTRAIDETANHISTIPDSDQPDNVIVVVLTDGKENASETPQDSVRERVEQRREEGWEFLFIGANQDAALTAEQMGMDCDKSLDMSHSGDGTEEAYRSTSRNISEARREGQTGGYTEEDRRRQGQADDA